MFHYYFSQTPKTEFLHKQVEAVIKKEDMECQTTTSNCDFSIQTDPDVPIVMQNATAQTVPDIRSSGMQTDPESKMVFTANTQTDLLVQHVDCQTDPVINIPIIKEKLTLVENGHSLDLTQHCEIQSSTDGLNTEHPDFEISTETLKIQTPKTSKKQKNKGNTEEVKPFKCDICNEKSYSAQKNLLRHQLGCKKESPFVCSYCGEDMKRSDKLQKHVLANHNPKKIKFST